MRGCQAFRRWRDLPCLLPPSTTLRSLDRITTMYASYTPSRSLAQHGCHSPETLRSSPNAIFERLFPATCEHLVGGVCRQATVMRVWFPTSLSLMLSLTPLEETMVDAIFEFPLSISLVQRRLGLSVGLCTRGKVSTRSASTLRLVRRDCELSAIWDLLEVRMVKLT